MMSLDHQVWVVLGLYEICHSLGDVYRNPEERFALMHVQQR